MKINVKIFGEDGKRILIPMPIYRLKDHYMQSIAGDMRMFGISEIVLTVSATNFLPAISVGTSTFLDDKIPAVLKAEQPEILRSLKIKMERAGFNSIKIELTPEEQESLLQYWTYVETGAATPGNVDIKTPVPEARDPTGQRVPLRVKLPAGTQLPGNLGRILAGGKS